VDPLIVLFGLGVGLLVGTGTVSLRIALWLAVGSIPGALGGVRLASESSSR
jgi:uncharacterized membrane protein YfcA